jgi:uncharacterized membrane protein
MLKIEYVYWLCGAILASCAWLDVRARRWTQAAFWGILAAAFLGGDAVLAAHSSGNEMPAQLAGVGVVALALLAGFGLRARAPAESDNSIGEREASAQRLGNRLFVPALAIPIVTLVLVLAQPTLRAQAIGIFDSRQETLVALGVACIVALLIALAVTRENLRTAIGESSRLLNALSWAALLPMLLATLGAVFAATGVGESIAHLTTAAIPTDSRLACVLAYALGMVVFTIIMGNAFAAFPVLTAGIGLPLLIAQHHANPAALCALGMLSGYCGTLLTPMAANFNIVPAALLELRDPYGVIRAQWPTALVLLVVNIGLIFWCAFP